MFKTKVLSLITVVLLVVLRGNAQDTTQVVDPLEQVTALEGIWKGVGEGFGQSSNVTHEWERILGGNFLRLITRSVSKEENGEESVHEDVGYVSWSKGESMLRFRQFLNEGFVNTFRIDQVKDSTSGFNFEPESTEGEDDLVARMTLRFDRPDEYQMILELGSKGKPLKACQTMRLKKIK